MNFRKNLRMKESIQLFFLLCLLFTAYSLHSYIQDFSFPDSGILFSTSIINGKLVPRQRERRTRINKNEIISGITGCSCSRSKKEMNDYAAAKANVEDLLVESTCSDFATLRGKNQKVISYSFYNPDNKTDIHSETFKKYLGTMRGRLKYVRSYLPGWSVRIYHNISADDVSTVRYMCKLHCSFPHLDLCNVTNLPTQGNLFERQPIGRLWRFAVMGDPTVSVFLVRDTDSYITRRELDAVNEWLNSTKEFHIMRDHPFHHTLMLAGLWGGRNIRRKELAELRDQMFSVPAKFEKKFDQKLLASYVYPFIFDSSLQHTSYNCELFISPSPFPSKREDEYFAGWSPFQTTKATNFIMKKECPVKCRPKNHEDWTYC